MWIFALAVFIIPLAMKIIPIHEAPFFGNLYPASILWDKVFSSVDMFNLVKVYIFYMVLALSLLIFTYLVIKDTIDLELEYSVFLAILLAATILITAYLSSYPEIAFWGVRDRYEGSVVWVAYLLIFIMVIYTVRGERQAKSILISSIIASIIMSLISLAEFLGISVYEIPILSLLIKGPKFFSSDLSSAASNISAATLYNPNYLSGYMSMMIALPLTFYLFGQRKNRQIIALVVAALFWASLLASKSSSGFVATDLILFILSALALYMDREAWKKLLILLLVFALIFTIMDIYIDGRMMGEYSSVFRYLGQIAAIDYSDIDDSAGVSDIDYLRSMQEMEPSNAHLWQELLENYPYQSSIDRLGSGRGFIWRFTSQLIANQPLTGYGMDTIIHTFPHGSMRKAHAFGNMDVLVDKPHSLYLQIAYGSGLIALLLFIALNAMIIWQSSRYLYRNFKAKELDSRDIIVLAHLMLVVGYLIQGIFNDSTIGLAIVYWIVLGAMAGLSSDKARVKGLAR